MNNHRRDSARDKKKLHLTSTETDNLDKASSAVTKRAKNYKAHQENTSGKNPGQILKEDINGMRKDYEKHAKKVNHLLEKFNLPTVACI